MLSSQVGLLIHCLYLGSSWLRFPLLKSLSAITKESGIFGLYKEYLTECVLCPPVHWLAVEYARRPE